MKPKAELKSANLSDWIWRGGRRPASSRENLPEPIELQCRSASRAMPPCLVLRTGVCSGLSYQQYDCYHDGSNQNPVCLSWQHLPLADGGGVGARYCGKGRPGRFDVSIGIAPRAVGGVADPRAVACFGRRGIDLSRHQVRALDGAVAMPTRSICCWRSTRRCSPSCGSGRLVQRNRKYGR